MGSSVPAAILTSIVTTVVLFFGLRALDQRGMLPSPGKPAAPAWSPPAATSPAAAAAPGPVEVPSLVGLRPEQARELLAGRGLMLAISAERDDAHWAAGTIAEQTPLPGSTLARAAGVQAVVSRGAPAQQPVPKVTGMRLRAARELLEHQGFKAGKIRYDSDGDRSPGVVLDQKPAPPATALAGTLVDLTVNED
jgi:beta-lactam-binding protein with PASTA domain